MKNFKSFFPYLVALALTYFSFLCLSIPYLQQSESFVRFFITGHAALSLWDAGWTGILVSLFQLFELLTMIGILIYAIICICLEFVAKSKQRETNPALHRVLMILFLVGFGLDFLVLIFAIVMSVVNDISLSAGLFLKIFFDIAALIGLLLGKYFFRDKPEIKAHPITFKESRPAGTNNETDN